MFAYAMHAPIGERGGYPMPGGLPRAPEVSFEIGRAFTLPELCEVLGISLRQVQAHIADGSIVAIDVGRGAIRRDLRVMEEAVEDFASRREVAPRGVPLRLSGRAPRRDVVRNRKGGL